MDCIEQLHSITNKMYKSLSDGVFIDIDEEVTEINRFLESRDVLIKRIEPSLLTGQNKNRLREIQTTNEKLTGLMQQIKSSIQQDIIKSKQGKTAFKGYHQTHISHSPDGHYFDKKN